MMRARRHPDVTDDSASGAQSTGFVTIDCLPESLDRYREGWTVVAIDIIRATTTAITAVASGRRCFPVPTLARAWQVADTLENPLLGGELGGLMPEGFMVNNSPAALADRDDIDRPLVLLSSSGTQLMHQVGGRTALFVACLRNIDATVAELARSPRRVAVIGAGTRGQFRPEDQFGCALVAAGLLRAGFACSPGAKDLIEIWQDAPVSSVTASPSADYLRRSDQLADLHFILDHVNDLDYACQTQGGELVVVPPAPLARSGPPPSLRKAVVT